MVGPGTSPHGYQGTSAHHLLINKKWQTTDVQNNIDKTLGTHAEWWKSTPKVTYVRHFLMKKFLEMVVARSYSRRGGGVGRSLWLWKGNSSSRFCNCSVSWLRLWLHELAQVSKWHRNLKTHMLMRRSKIENLNEMTKTEQCPQWLRYYSSLARCYSRGKQETYPKYHFLVSHSCMWIYNYLNKHSNFKNLRNRIWWQTPVIPTLKRLQ
jgi:hypothetical protein